MNEKKDYDKALKQILFPYNSIVFGHQKSAFWIIFNIIINIQDSFYFMHFGRHYPKWLSLVGGYGKGVLPKDATPFMQECLDLNPGHPHKRW